MTVSEGFKTVSKSKRSKRSWNFHANVGRLAMFNSESSDASEQFVTINFFIFLNIYLFKKVLWAQQQVSKRRVKRDMIDLNDEKFSKRAENLAYRAVAYDDPRWDDQW
jgi:hypothetical protein